ncbi:MAG: hypothetical protein AAGE59_27520 [Cyanobacteria bacterium P01_F01_bin.86]
MRFINFLQQISISVVVALVIEGALPTVGWAQPRDLDIVMNADATADFWQLMAEAETLVTANISQTFAANPSITRLHVEVVAERNGAVVPLMLTQVSRQSWQAEAEVARWTQYFGNAQVLLSYVTPAIATASPPSRNAITITERSQQQIQLEDALD